MAVVCIFFLFVFSVVVFFPPFPAALFMDIDRMRLASTRPSAADLQLSAAATSSRHQTRAKGGEGGEGGGSLSVSSNTIGELVLRRMANIISSPLIFNVANVATEPDGSFSVAVLWAVRVLYDRFYTAD